MSIINKRKIIYNYNQKKVFLRKKLRIKTTIKKNKAYYNRLYKKILKKLKNLVKQNFKLNYICYDIYLLDI